MTDRITIRDTINRIAPPWLRGYFGSRLLYALSVPWDALIDATIDAISASFPGYSTLESLPYLARDRRMIQGHKETDAEFANRLRSFRIAHSTRGSVRTLLRQLRAYLAGDPVKIEAINASGDRWVIDADGTESWERATSWAWDPNTTTQWSRFWVVIHAYESPGLISPVGIFSDPHPFGSGTLGCTWDSTQVERIRAVVADWSAAHCPAINTIFVFDKSAWDAKQPLDHNWQYWGNRCPAAVYFDGTIQV